jgi:hypothetical protein
MLFMVCVQATALQGPLTGVAAHAEFGFLGVAAHDIQFGTTGTYFDYVDEGGQDVLFPVARVSVDMTMNDRHVVTLLYQPLSLETSALVSRDITVDDMVFPAGTPMRFVYRFPFYRASWMYDLYEAAGTELAFGLSLQIRNATIVFASRDGELYRDNRNIGPVPVLKSRGSYGFDNGFFLGYEIDGFYAPVSYLNGSDEEVTGAIVDASVRGGVTVVEDKGVCFCNIRYLAGGAVGTNTDETGPGDGYVKNWLHFYTVTLGATWHVGR